MRVSASEGEGEDEHRHRCLVRWVLAIRVKDRDEAHRWLRGYRGNDGRWNKGWNEMHPGSVLERDVVEQWARGNRGVWADWRAGK